MMTKKEIEEMELNTITYTSTATSVDPHESRPFTARSSFLMWQLNVRGWATDYPSRHITEGAD